MGLMSQGEPLSWEQTKKHAEHVRKHGIEQFINIYHHLKNRQDNCLKWGDEIEYMIVKFDEQQKRVRVSLRANELLAITDQWEAKQPDNCQFLWRPEFAAYMIEGTPGKPYGDEHAKAAFEHLTRVEKNMRGRRQQLEQLLQPNEVILCITSFPQLGVGDFCVPPAVPRPLTSATGSLFFPDECIFPAHPRFKTLVKNIRARRKRKVAINLPLFFDKNTPNPFVEKFAFEHPETDQAALPNHVYMDAMGFGMGCSCLQVTFQGSNLVEARTLYDQLAPLCPLIMALSAASPVHRGWLTERDCRWSVVSASVDDRTATELGEQPIPDCSQYQPPTRDANNKHIPVRTCSCGNTHYQISKSRYDSIDSYISEAGELYNDIPVTYHVDYFERLKAAGVDEVMARHIAHLFIRDPISVYQEKLEQDDNKDSDHFENLQSTNWQTMRFKPPPPGSNIGWRVEFRPMEVQLTEFENAAFVIFIVLLTRMILAYRLNLLIPLSKVDCNMKEAQKRDSVNQSKFWFRRDIISEVSPPEAACCVQAAGCCVSNDRNKNQPWTLMSLNQIINGDGSKEYPGLVPLLRSYMLSMEIDADNQCMLQQYLSLISDRAAGKCWTQAAFIRNFIQSHPKYGKDSQVGPEVTYDLLKKMYRISRGEEASSELFGDSSARVQANSRSSKQN